MPATYTHVGCRERVGYRHCGSRLAGHVERLAGKRHALNYVGRARYGEDKYLSLCGEVVIQRLYLDSSDGVADGPPAVVAPAAEGRQITCRRCLRQLADALEG